jgi:hypothetical protein
MFKHTNRASSNQKCSKYVNNVNLYTYIVNKSITKERVNLTFKGF